MYFVETHKRARTLQQDEPLSFFGRQHCNCCDGNLFEIGLRNNLKVDIFYSKVLGADELAVKKPIRNIELEPYPFPPQVFCFQCDSQLDCPYISTQRCPCLRSDGFPMYRPLPPIRVIRPRSAACGPCMCPMAMIMACMEPTPYCSDEQFQTYV